MEKIVSSIWRISKIGVFSAVCVCIEIWGLKTSFISTLLAIGLFIIFLLITLISIVIRSEKIKLKRQKLLGLFGIFFSITTCSYVFGTIQNHLVIKQSEILYQLIQREPQYCIRGCTKKYRGYLIYGAYLVDKGGMGKNESFVSADLFNFKRVYITEEGTRFKNL